MRGLLFLQKWMRPCLLDCNIMPCKSPQCIVRLLIVQSSGSRGKIVYCNILLIKHHWYPIFLRIGNSTYVEGKERVLTLWKETIRRVGNVVAASVCATCVMVILPSSTLVSRGLQWIRSNQRKAITLILSQIALLWWMLPCNIGMTKWLRGKCFWGSHSFEMETQVFRLSYSLFIRL